MDPSHSTGHWEFVEPIALAGIAAGADGLMVEVHVHPQQALSDGMQSLKPERFAELVQKVEVLCSALGRSVAESKHSSRGEREGLEKST
jgi:3-deoxy-7-phosphoheptulonate synthase